MDSFNEIINQLVENINLGDTEQVKSLLIQAENEANNDSSKWLLVSDYYAVLNDIENAVRCVQKAIELDPNNAQAHYYMAILFEHQNDIANADNEYVKAISLAPLDAYYCKYAQLFQNTDINKSVYILKQGLLTNPDSAAIIFNLALLLSSTDLKQSLSLFKRAVELADNNQDKKVILENNASILHASGQAANAVVAYRMALEYGELSKEAEEDYALSLQDSSNYEQALNVFNKLLADEPENILYIASKTILLYALGNIQESLDTFNKLKSLDNKYIYVHDVSKRLKIINAATGGYNTAEKYNLIYPFKHPVKTFILLSGRTNIRKWWQTYAGILLGYPFVIWLLYLLYSYISGKFSLSQVKPAVFVSTCILVDVPITVAAGITGKIRRFVVSRKK